MAKLAWAMWLGAVLGLAACGQSKVIKPTDGGTGTPGADYLCDSSGATAWQTYRQAGFYAVTHSIVQNIRADVAANGTGSQLGDSFTKVGSGRPSATRDNWATFEGYLAAFLVYSYGGPSTIKYSDGQTYEGEQDMVVAHTGLNISAIQYDYFIANIVRPALVDNQVPDQSGGASTPNDINSCFAPPLTGGDFRAAFIEH